MKQILPKNLIELAGRCPFPLYVVGGSVRDFLAGKLSSRPDWDIAAPCGEDELISRAEQCGFRVKSVYRHTGTVKLSDSTGAEYEFTRFRSDKYVRGLHTPSEIIFTDDIGTDARRRDFCVNAIYYDVKAGAFVDPLGGMDDVKKKLLRTVVPAYKVFGEDGLRLMRLCRFSAELGFSPDAEALQGARRHCALIRDIAPERIFTELTLLLHADRRGGSPYRGLQVMRDTDVLKEVLPELALGNGMAQRKDFHDYDVLEHSLRCVMYAPPEIRFAALLHDVGKPFCFLRDGNFYAHPDEGARIAGEILSRLKAPKKLTTETCSLVKLHMRDLDLKMKESKIRRTIVENYSLLEKLFALKQADFSACKDDTSPAPTVVKWRKVLQAMREEGVPFTVKELAVNGTDLLRRGIPPEQIGGMLSELLDYCTQDGSRNDCSALLKRISTQEDNP